MKQQNDFANTLWGLAFYGVLGCFCIGSLLVKDEEFSYRERRRLTTFPQTSWTEYASGEFQEGFESYVQDNILDRDLLLELRSLSARYLFGAQDDFGVVLKDGSLVAMEQELHPDSFDYASGLFDKLYASLLEGSDCSLYAAIVPDKSSFLDETVYPVLNDSELLASAQNVFPFATWIDIAPSLSLDMYYRTDPHWKQEDLASVADVLLEEMGEKVDRSYETKDALEHFYGSLAGRSFLPVEPDQINYLWSEDMEDWTVTIYDSGRPVSGEIYDFKKLNGLDPYDFYLEGNQGLAVLENPNGNPDKELVVFRDSFGSSIAPLLMGDYSKITLIDLRNLPSWRLSSLLEFDRQDVLFLYSASSLNNAKTMK